MHCANAASRYLWANPLPMNTPVAVLLSRKGSAVQAVAPSDTVADAVRVMNEKKIGSVLVVEGGRLSGIFTERDVLSRVVAAGVDPRTTRVSAVMTARLETIAPDMTLGEVMGLFTNKRCRHLPVVCDGELLGLISIGDVSRWLADTHRAEVEHLRQYIAGGYPT
jgi:CBS domain-containing protein